jgi:hypothetical protein
LATPPDVELGDTMIEDISNVLDSVEQSLANRTFAFPLRTSTALLAVRVPVADVDPEKERNEVSATIAELRAILAERPEPHPDVQIMISMRVNAVRRRAPASGGEIVGGPLLEVGSWTANHRVPKS